jgi:hypothetical protein
MDQSSSEQKTTQPQVLLKWQFPSFQQHDRGFTWYVIAGAIAIAFFIYAMVQKNFLFAIIIILIAITLIAKDFLSPHQVQFTVDEDGVSIGDKSYRFREFDTFWLAYEPPQVKMLYLTFKSGVRPSYPIPLGNENPLRVRTVLQKYIREDLEQESEDLSDRLGRMFKL